MVNKAPIDLAAFEQADRAVFEITHSNMVVDTSEPLTGVPEEYDEGRDELVVNLDDRDAHAFISVYEHDGETVLATLGHPGQRVRDRGMKFTVTDVEGRWNVR